MSWEVLQGDVREMLSEIPEKSIQCVVTSPPYWGLRDYGTEGQIGLEKTPDEYVQNMVEVFRGVWKVLRDDGTAWLNLGDSYAGSNQGVGTKNLTAKQASNRGTVALTQATKSTLVKVEGCKPKDLVGIPWRVAFALQADGWYLRSDIIWHKPNPMPESVTDRPTKSHEYIFLLTKSQKYFYDAEAVKENSECAGKTAKSGGSIDGLGKGFDGNRTRVGLRKNMVVNSRRNKRSVWTVATQPYPEAHFAVYPPKLIEPCILAGTSPQACEVCGSPWERITEKERTFESGSGKSRNMPQGKNGHALQGGGETLDIRRGPCVKATTIGWQPTCSCDNEGKGRCKVLDPFAGSGTTLWVAENHGRDSVGIELNSEYVKLIEKRMSNFQQTIFSL